MTPLILIPSFTLYGDQGRRGVVSYWERFWLRRLIGGGHRRHTQKKNAREELEI
jgi:hypothetical protein